jgi:cytoskeleton protein RodZ
MDVGAQLRQAREGRGLTIDAISHSTRVQHRILTAIEQNDPASLPPRPYGRGFVRSFALEVGLDPDIVVRDFFSQFAPVAEPPAVVERHSDRRAERSAPRGWLWSAALVVVYAVVGAMVIAAGRWAMQPRVEEGAVGTAGALSSPPARAVAHGPATSPVAKAPATPTVVRVNLEAARAVWVTAVVDGDRTVYRTLQAGERVALNGTHDVTLRVGDAGAIVWQVNGRPSAPMGQSGEVRTERVTLEDALRTK